MDIESWKIHLQTECDGQKLNCQVCGFNVYRKYNGVDFDRDGGAEGHNCIRDIKMENMLQKKQIASL